MDEIYLAFSEIHSGLPWHRLFTGLILIAAGQLILKISDTTLLYVVENKKYRTKVLSVRKIAIYIYNFILFLLFLKIMKVEMKVILSAMGFMTLAIAFAARTPISNLISGVFLVFERPFVVGSIIQVGEYTGEVVSRNLLSLTMRTLDNIMVRIPNEKVIGNAVSNYSHFPIRRLEVTYLLSNKDSLTRLEEIFQTVAERNTMALNEPEPYFTVEEFRENCFVVKFFVWSPVDDFLEFQSKFPQELHRAVRKAGMESIRQQVEILGPIKMESGSNPS